MQDDKFKAPYLALFNSATDACRILEEAQDTGVAMEVVPGYEPEGTAVQAPAAPAPPKEDET